MASGASLLALYTLTGTPLQPQRRSSASACSTLEIVTVFLESDEFSVIAHFLRFAASCKRESHNAGKGGCAGAGVDGLLEELLKDGAGGVIE